MTKYKENKINLLKLKLDKDNPRYSTYSDNKSDMLSFMLNKTESKIDDLAVDILENGSLNPLDVIGAIQDKNKYIVVDGNRRIAALKLIFEENNHKSRRIIESINNHQQEYSSIKKYINNIRIVVFDNRNEADKWIERKHSVDGGKTLQGWDVFEQHIHKNNPIAIIVRNKMKEYGINREEYVSIVKWSVWNRIFSGDLLNNYFGIKKEESTYKIESEKDFQRKINLMIDLFRQKKLTYNSDFVSNSQIKHAILFMDKYLSSDNLITAREALENYLKSKNSTKMVNSNNKNAKKGTNKTRTNIKINKINFDSKIIIKNKKIFNLLKQIESIKKPNKYVELISMAIRPLIEFMTKEYCIKILKLSEKQKKSYLHILVENVRNDIIQKTLFHEKNKKVINNFMKKDSEEMKLSEINDLMHDIEYSLTKNELIKVLERVDIYLLEAQKVLDK